MSTLHTEPWKWSRCAQLAMQARRRSHDLVMIFYRRSSARARPRARAADLCGPALPPAGRQPGVRRCAPFRAVRSSASTPACSATPPNHDTSKLTHPGTTTCRPERPALRTALMAQSDQSFILPKMAKFLRLSLAHVHAHVALPAPVANCHSWLCNTYLFDLECCRSLSGEASEESALIHISVRLYLRSITKTTATRAIKMTAPQVSGMPPRISLRASNTPAITVPINTPANGMPTEAPATEPRRPSI